jgi:murein L,D-transpeptidase YcbB/YkuD
MEAMKGKNRQSTSWKKIRYIGYFTAWVDDAEQINFHNDLYQRDNP